MSYLQQNELNVTTPLEAGSYTWGTVFSTAGQSQAWATQEVCVTISIYYRTKSRMWHIIMLIMYSMHRTGLEEMLVDNTGGFSMETAYQPVTWASWSSAHTHICMLPLDKITVRWNTDYQYWWYIDYHILIKINKPKPCLNLQLRGIYISRWFLKIRL